MIVQCESCHTKFRLDPARMKGASAKVRCTRCGTVFSVQSDEEVIQVDISDEPMLSQEEFEPAPSVQLKTAPDRPRKFRLPLVAIIGSAAVILAVVGIYWFASSKTSVSSVASQQAKHAPKGMEQPAVTALDTTQAYFLENVNVGQIFVVEGETVNESDKPVSFILIEGKLFNKTDQVLQTQRCYSGNTMTREELKHLSLADIQNQMMNREGKKLANVNVPPSKRTPFVLVFHNLPELDALGTYSIDVISSKFD